MTSSHNDGTGNRTLCPFCGQRAVNFTCKHCGAFTVYVLHAECQTCGNEDGGKVGRTCEKCGTLQEYSIDVWKKDNEYIWLKITGSNIVASMRGNFLTKNPFIQEKINSSSQADASPPASPDRDVLDLPIQGMGAKTVRELLEHIRNAPEEQRGTLYVNAAIAFVTNNNSPEVTFAYLYLVPQALQDLSYKMVIGYILTLNRPLKAICVYLSLPTKEQAVHYENLFKRTAAFGGRDIDTLVTRVMGFPRKVRELMGMVYFLAMAQALEVDQEGAGYPAMQQCVDYLAEALEAFSIEDYGLEEVFTCIGTLPQQVCERVYRLLIGYTIGLAATDDEALEDLINENMQGGQKVQAKRLATLFTHIFTAADKVSDRTRLEENIHTGARKMASGFKQEATEVRPEEIEDNVVEHLLNHGHAHRAVDTFIERYLRPMNEMERNKGQIYVTTARDTFWFSYKYVDNPKQYLNDLLRKVQKTRNSKLPIPLVVLWVLLGIESYVLEEPGCSGCCN